MARLKPGETILERRSAAVVWRIVGPKQIDVLLVRPWKMAAWSIPFGSVEKGRYSDEFVVEMTMKQTGIDIQISDLIVSRLVKAVMNRRKGDPKKLGKVRQYIYLASAVDPKAEVICNNEEYNIEEVEWWPIDRLPFIYQHLRRFIFSAIDGLVAHLGLSEEILPVYLNTALCEAIELHSKTIEWKTIKKTIFHSIPWQQRHYLGEPEMEKRIIARWTELTGNELIFKSR